MSPAPSPSDFRRRAARLSAHTHIVAARSHTSGGIR